MAWGILILSIVLIIVGFIMVVTGIFWAFMILVMRMLKNIAETIIYIFFSIYDLKNVHLKLGNAKWTKKELDMIDQMEYSKRPKYEERARKEVYDGILIFSSRMKAKYPNADKSLFRKIETEFLQESSLDVFKEYENMIRESHIKNGNKRVKTGKKLKLSNLDGLTPIEKRVEYPLIVELYKVNNDYVLRVIDKSTDTENLFQSSNYTLVRKYMEDMKREQEKIRLKKGKVKAISLDDFYKS